MQCTFILYSINCPFNRGIFYILLWFISCILYVRWIRYCILWQSPQNFMKIAWEWRSRNFWNIGKKYSYDKIKNEKLLVFIRFEESLTSAKRRSDDWSINSQYCIILQVGFLIGCRLLCTPLCYFDLNLIMVIVHVYHVSCVLIITSMKFNGIPSI